MNFKVSIVRQVDYDESELEGSIRNAIDLCDFDLRSVAGKKVLLKPNLLGAFPPERGVTTNPSFVYAAARVFIESGAEVSVGDSPNGIFEPELCWKTSGLKDACERAGARETHFESGGSRRVGKIMLANAALDADILVNLPKLKTHSLTGITVATKNLFGCVSGMMKSGHHRDNPRRDDFSRLLVEIAEAIKPALNIVDGIEAMEGNGPSSGSLRNISAIIAGSNHHAVDTICAKIIKQGPANVDTLRAASNMGVWDLEAHIETAGDEISDFICEDFKMPATFNRGAVKFGISKMLERVVWSNLSTQPAIDANECRRCYLCVKACPVEAIEHDPGKPPMIDKKTCIQCLCCHEVCPYKAIHFKQSWLSKLGRWHMGR